MKKENEYIPFGPEWEKELMKNDKKTIVSMFRTCAMQVLALETEKKDASQFRSEPMEPVSAKEIIESRPMYKNREEAIGLIRNFRIKVAIVGQGSFYVNINATQASELVDALIASGHLYNHLPEGSYEEIDALFPINKHVLDEWQFKVAELKRDGAKDYLDWLRSKVSKGTDNFEVLFEKHQEFTTKTFLEATAESSLIKLKGEANEAIAELQSNNEVTEKLILEYVDVVMCWADSIKRAGISLQAIREAFVGKMDINQSRTWKKNLDGTYSHKK